MILLDHHKQAKREIVTRFQQLADVADRVGMTTLSRDIRTTRIPKLEAERFHLVVLGEFNHGKSTFVNALLGADILPTGITPTTASINHVVHADRATARVMLTSGESRPLEPSRARSGTRALDLRPRQDGYAVRRRAHGCRRLRQAGPREARAGSGRVSAQREGLGEVQGSRERHAAADGVSRAVPRARSRAG